MPTTEKQDHVFPYVFGYLPLTAEESLTLPGQALSSFTAPLSLAARGF